MNSRPRISNHHDLLKLIENYQSLAADNGTRALLVLLSPPAGWLEIFSQSSGGDFLDATSTTDRADRIASLLGTERRMAIMQLGHSPDIGLLAAASGTLTAGGVMIIGACAVFDSGADQLNENCIPGAGPNSAHSHKRLLRLVTNLAQSYPESVAVVECSIKPDAKGHISSIPQVTSSAHQLHAGKSAVSNPAAAVEQDELLSTALNHLKTNAHTCLVIKGRRGRGKSTLLARLARQLDVAGTEFRITASHTSALSAFYKHAAQTLDRYVSPEAALRAPAEVILVDEAASLSFKQLQQFLTNYRHVVLCTTVDGYEAAGRAFDMRLLADLSQPSMAILHLETRHPWRWTDDDVLEKFTDQLILNKREDRPDSRHSPTCAQEQKLAANCQLTQVSQDELASDEALLAGVHSLLQSTHYQTTTKDLEHLLDAPTVQVWIHTLNNTVVSALVLECEGNLQQSLHEPILAKARRLPNQLLPQLLAQTANCSTALENSYLRIIRLAVSPELRRQKLASQLLRAVTEQYIPSIPVDTPPPTSEKVDAIGASFAADECSLGFWKSHGYTEFHRGFRLNPRTGKHAVAMLKSFNPQTANVLTIAADIHRDNERARHAPLLCAENIWQDATLTSRDIQLLHRFAAGQRSKHDTDAALKRLFSNSGQRKAELPHASKRQHELELRRYVQQRLARLDQEQSYGLAGCAPDE